MILDIAVTSYCALLLDGSRQEKRRGRRGRLRLPIWYGLWAPAETPAPVIAELAAAVSEALRSPQLASLFEEHGAEILRLSQTEFADFVTSEVARARRLAWTAGRPARA
jgi:tripartite-type tricarboxylate transporter receptor subunit TctC